MRAKVRQALDAIEDVLLQGDEDARDLAAILSALRGPDAEQGDPSVHTRKLNSTCVVRRLAFPRLAQQAYEVRHVGVTSSAATICGWSMGLPDHTMITPPDTGWSVCDSWGVCGAHFEQHIARTTKALGLPPWED